MMATHDDPARSGRALCGHCRRPLVVCYCRHLHRLPTRTRVVLLQHPREQDKAIGTARIAHLSLPNSVLRVGLDFSTDPVVGAALGGPSPVYVLFPRRGAKDVLEMSPDQAITLVVLDGTWWQARKLLTLNPALAALPRVAFVPRRPSDYRIRRQPAEFCVSTIEALAEVLDVLEPDRGPFDRLLYPFRAMVDHQLRFATEVRSTRHLQPRRRRRPAPPTLAARLAADWPHLVCIQGEANAWPARDPARQEPEIVHWVAHRLSTGESYEAVVAPRRPLAPSTPGHVEVSAARLRDGDTAEAWRRGWQAFCRPDDVLVQWGTFYSNLASSDGLTVPARHMDMRIEVSHMLRRRVGTQEGCAAQLGATSAVLGLDGRGGRRLAALVGMVSALRE